MHSLAGMAEDKLVSSMQELYLDPPRDVRESGHCSSNNPTSRRRFSNQVMEGESVSGSHLPDEVLSMVLAFLPLMNVLKCRLVGTRWNLLSQGELFRETYSRVSGDLPLQYIQLLEKSRGFAGSQVVSSVGGRLLVTTYTETGDQLYVVNPMTATLKLIPAMLGLETSSKHAFSVVGMVVNSDASVYKILAAQEGARPVRLQVYDSSHGAWQWAGTWTVRRPWSWRESTSSLFTYIQEDCTNVEPISFNVLNVAMHDGALYCLCVGGARHFRILRLEPSSNRWVELPGIFPPSPSTFDCDFRCRPVLFENKGSLMLAGAQVTGPISITVTVWQYDGEDAQWMMVASAQEQVEEEGDLCGASYLDVTFFYLDACGDHVCLGAFPSFRNPDPKVLIYNIPQDSWSLSKLGQKESQTKLIYWQKRAFFYEPRSVSRRAL